MVRFNVSHCTENILYRGRKPGFGRQSVINRQNGIPGGKKAFDQRRASHFFCTKSETATVDKKYGRDHPCYRRTVKVHTLGS